jgi:hypothetical protein
VKSAELHGDASADSDEGGEGALVEGEGAFIAVDGLRGDEGVWVGG